MACAPLRVSKRIWRIPLVGPDLVNAYLVADVLIDSGVRTARRRLLQVLAGRDLSCHILTHAHPDHQGCSQAVCERFQIPLYCGAGDREAQETGRFRELMHRPGSLAGRVSRLLSGPPHPVARTFGDGDTIGGLAVVETPGHTPGHLSFWDEEEGVLILGDVLLHRRPPIFRQGLTEPPGFATRDRRANRISAGRLAALDPRVVCFGHGPPLRDGERFRRFVRELASPARSGSSG